MRQAYVMTDMEKKRQPVNLVHGQIMLTFCITMNHNNVDKEHLKLTKKKYPTLGTRTSNLSAKS